MGLEVQEGRGVDREAGGERDLRGVDRDLRGERDLRGDFGLGGEAGDSKDETATISSAVRSRSTISDKGSDALSLESDDIS